MPISKFRTCCCLSLSLLAVQPSALFAQTGVLSERYKPHFQRNTSDASPISLARCAPAYPRESMRNEETGATTLVYKTSDTGHLLDIRLVKSSGFVKLDNAVIEALRKCRFKPASNEGKAVQGFTSIQYIWRLD